MSAEKTFEDELLSLVEKGFIVRIKDPYLFTSEYVEVCIRRNNFTVTRITPKDQLLNVLIFCKREFEEYVRNEKF